jgi:DUF4097 and DUF4098 domain-containing protein YvlB
VSTQAGHVDIDSLAGSADVTVVAGDISVRAGQGRLRAHAVAGNVTVENAGDDVRADVVDGNITIANARGLNVEARSVSGSVQCSGALPQGADWVLETFSGDVRLRVPATTSATITMESFAGRLRSELPSPVAMSGGGAGPVSRGVLRLGSPATGGAASQGEARVSMKSFSGNVVVSPPGRNEQ